MFGSQVLTLRDKTDDHKMLV
ncbi:hypothetical protein SIAM614_22737 [Stappia aggregata IAM 12614]|uniref:Uncharacterized protein n=1 Tax=Roseibium aggregatum (strain ATCC 25650 / DSM 13394 / JCM 20685 / NBRC 16684 / NCIMB 2208 / IAM 12614 / B1) TaxID=384765 RepID=A0P439_ROSAI|nr:hypothetical protein SIAM614_22737 [Stappia aggregata IAM 12614] [Roseibium aggregatum IAM 12614]